MFDENKFVCLINDCFVDSKSTFIDIKTKIDQQCLDDNDHQGNKLYTAALLENLVCALYFKSYDFVCLLNFYSQIYFANKKFYQSIQSKVENENVQNLDSIYELTGVCNLVVFLHKAMTIDHLKNLLIYDLIRSLHSRIRLLVEDLDARKDIIGKDNSCNLKLTLFLTIGRLKKATILFSNFLNIINYKIDYCKVISYCGRCSFKT